MTRTVLDRAVGAPPQFDTSSIRPGVGPTRARFGRWFDAHPSLLRAIASIALVWQAAYLTWRVCASWQGANLLLSATLFAAELYGWVSLGLLAWFSWSPTPTPGPGPRRGPCADPARTVDVFVCTYNEALEVLRPTLMGCAALSYPHTTYLLDDGRRPEMKALAEEYGAVWVTRGDNAHAKAGNINHALTVTTGDLIFVLDADHVPQPYALDALVGYFDDHVALVQTPHDFYNHDSVQHYDVGRHEQSVFFEVVCPGKDRSGSAFWCGSATLIRRDALLAVGGVATETIAEDFHTTIKMHQKGWHTRYHAEAVVQGLGPLDLDGYLVQRDRWARGNLSVLHTPQSPLRARELRLTMRISYAASLLAYAAGPMRLLVLAILAATLWTGQVPMTAPLAPFALLWAPSTALTMLAGTSLARGHVRLAESIHFELLTGEIYTRALRCLLSPSRAAFKVTPKSGLDDGGWGSIRRLHALLLLATALTIGLVLRVAMLLTDHAGLPHLPGLPAAALPGFSALPDLAAIVVPTLAAVELRRVVRTLVIVGRRRQRRATFRFGCAEPAIVMSPTVGIIDGAVLRDASIEGLGIDLPPGVPADEEVVVWLALPRVGGGQAVERITATVRSSRQVADGSWRIGAGIDGGSCTAPRSLWEFTFILCPARRLRGQHVAPTAPAASLMEWETAVTPSEHDSTLTTHVPTPDYEDIAAIQGDLANRLADAIAAMLQPSHPAFAEPADEPLALTASGSASGQQPGAVTFRA